MAINMIRPSEGEIEAQKFVASVMEGQFDTELPEVFAFRLSGIAGKSIERMQDCTGYLHNDPEFPIISVLLRNIALSNPEAHLITTSDENRMKWARAVLAITAVKDNSPASKRAVIEELNVHLSDGEVTKEPVDFEDNAQGFVVDAIRSYLTPRVETHTP